MLTQEFAWAVQIVTAIILSVSAVVAVFTLLSIRKFHRENHAWNRRQAAFEALKGLRTVDTEQLRIQTDWNDRRTTVPLDEIQELFEKKPELIDVLGRQLNFFEGLAIGVDQKVYDANIVKIARKKSMKLNLRRFKAYIDHRREEVNDKLWIEQERLIQRWDEEDERDRRINSLPKTGK